MKIFKYLKFNSFSIPKKIFKNIILYQDIDIFQNHYIVLPNHKLIYLVTPKSGCTSIMTNLGQSYNIYPYSNDGKDIHSNPNWNKELRIIRKKYQNYFKFTFVRNPFARIVSCYKDKILMHENYDSFYFENYHYKIKSDVTFNEFIKIIANIPDFLADRHFKSQYFSIIKNNKYKIDFIGKLENTTTDWQNLASTFNLKNSLPHKNKSGQNNNYFDYYDFNTAELVFKRYREDIDFFGYKYEYLKLINYLKTKKL